MFRSNLPSKQVKGKGQTQTKLPTLPRTGSSKTFWRAVLSYTYTVPVAQIIYNNSYHGIEGILSAMSYSETQISSEMSTMMIHSSASLFRFCRISK